MVEVYHLELAVPVRLPPTTDTRRRFVFLVELSIRALLVSVLSLSWQLVHFHQENGGEQAWRVVFPHSGKFSMRSSLTILECLTFPDPSLPLHIL